MCDVSDRQAAGISGAGVAELHQRVGQPGLLAGLDLLELFDGDLESTAGFGLFLVIVGLGAVQGDGGLDHGIPGSLECLLGVLAVGMGIVDEQDRLGAGAEGVADLGTECSVSRDAPVRCGKRTVVIALQRCASHDDRDFILEIDALEVAVMGFGCIDRVAQEDQFAADLS